MKRWHVPAVENPYDSDSGAWVKWDDIKDLIEVATNIVENSYFYNTGEKDRRWGINDFRPLSDENYDDLKKALNND